MLTSLPCARWLAPRWTAPVPTLRRAPSLPQESFERLLFQVEAAFWFYDDEYREIWPHAFPCYTLLQFAQKLFSMCELLTPFARRTEELYDKFRQYKIQIPTCGAMLLNPGATKVLLVMGYKSKSWGCAAAFCFFKLWECVAAVCLVVKVVGVRSRLLAPPLAF
jgi:hypothetical protein